MTNTNKFNTGKMVRLAILIAIIFVMAFTPLGYFRTPGLSVSFLSIPVAVGAMILGPSAGAILGGVFGLTSFIQCFGMEAFGTTLLSINWFYTLIVCFVSRILMGWICGLIFQALKKIDKTKIISYVVAGLSAPVLNTVFFMSSLILFFYNTPYLQETSAAIGATGIWSFVVLFVGISGVIEAIIGTIAAPAIAKALDVVLVKNKR